MKMKKSKGNIASVPLGIITLPTFLQQTMNLINSATVGLLAIIAVLTVAVVLFYIVKYLIADTNDRPGIMKAIRTTVIIGVAALVVDGVFAWVSSFYS